MSINNNTEIWKDIPKYKGYYQASNHGKIRSLNRIIPHPTIGFQTLKGKTLKSNPIKDGYLRVDLSMNGVVEHHQVHRLILYTFVGNPPDGYTQTNHKDGVKTNNMLNNLEWIDASGNMRHAIDVLKRSFLRGEAHQNSKLTENNVREIRQKYKNKEASMVALAKEYGVSDGTISGVISYSIWKHVD